MSFAKCRLELSFSDLSPSFPLSAHLVHAHCGCRRNVERLNFARHRNFYTTVSHLNQRRFNSIFLRAKHECKWFCEVAVVTILREFFSHAHHRNSTLLKIRNRIFERRHFANRNLKQRARRRFHCIGTNFSRTTLRNHNCVNAHTFCRSCDCAKIPNVAHLVKNDDERIFALLKKRWHNLFQILKFYGRHKRNNALVRLARDFIQFFNRNTFYGNILFPSKINNLTDLLVVRLFLYQNLVDGLAFLKSLKNCVAAVNHILLLFHTLRLCRTRAHWRHRNIVVRNLYWTNILLIFLNIVLQSGKQFLCMLRS